MTPGGQAAVIDVDPMKDMLDRLFTGFEPPAVDADAFDSRQWEAVRATGLLHAAIAEDRGGAGMAWIDALPLLQIAGRHALRLPLFETMLAAWLLDRAGWPPGGDPMTVLDGSCTLTRHGAGWRLALDGIAPWARHATLILAVVSGDEAAHIVRLKPPDAAIQPDRNLADEPRERLCCDLDLHADQVSAPQAANLAETVTCLLTASRVQLMAGAMARVLEMTVAYAGARIQFGRPIGGFQAIQHAIAQMAGQAALGAGAANLAAERCEPADRFAVGAAKIVAGDAAGAVAAFAHQVHGAMGFAREHDLNLFTRRLWSWRDERGGETVWAEELGAAVAGLAPADHWRRITAPGDMR